MGGKLAHGPANRGQFVLQSAAPLFVQEPRGQAPRGGIIVLHGLLGLTPDTEQACRRLARGGRFAVAPILYHEHGGPVFPPSHLAAAKAEIAGVSPRAMAQDVAAAVGYLSGRDCPGSTVLGFGAGGYLAAWAAARIAGIGAALAVGPLDLPGFLGRDCAAWRDAPSLASLLAACVIPWRTIPAAVPESGALDEPGYSLVANFLARRQACQPITSGGRH